MMERVAQITGIMEVNTMFKRLLNALSGKIDSSEIPWYVRMEAIRVLHGMDRKELANRVGTSYWIYYQWANGNYRPLEMNQEAICRVLNVPKSLIFG